jgi:hypothetical protein
VSASLRVAVLRVLLGIVVAVALAGAVTGVWFVAADLSERGEMFDGLGALIGALVLGGSILAGVLAAVAAAGVVRRPMLARVIGVLLALAAAALVCPLAVDTDWGVWLAPFPLALVVVAVLPDRSAR